MPLSVNVSTGLVKGRFGSGVVAGPNGEKLLVPARGRIDFEPVAPYVPYPTGTPSAFTILRRVTTGLLDSEGYLCTPHPDYPEVPGVRGLELYSPDDPQAGVQGWTWRGTPRFVNADGTRLHNAMEPFTFDLPYGEEVDLVNVVDMPQSPGIGKEQAIILAASAQAHAASADAAAEAAAADAKVAREGVATAVEAASTAVSEVETAKTVAASAAADAGRAVGLTSTAQAAATEAASKAGSAQQEASTAKDSAATAVTAAERAGSDSATAKTAAAQAAADAADVKDKAAANDAGVAGFLKSGPATTAALESTINAVRPRLDLVSALRGKSPLYISHRGGPKLYPEHSMEGYRASAATGFLPEIDVQALSDGTLVCLHDEDTWRTMTGAAMAPRNMTLAHWREKRIKAPMAGGKQALPVLWEDVLDEFGGRIVIVAEIKVDSTKYVAPAVIAAVIESVKMRGLEKSVILQCFNYAVCQQVAAAGIETLYLNGVEPPPQTPAQLKADGVNFLAPDKATSAANVARMQAAGITVWAYTVNTRADRDAVLAKGITGIMSDDPWGISGRHALEVSEDFRRGTLWPLANPFYPDNLTLHPAPGVGWNYLGTGFQSAIRLGQFGAGPTVSRIRFKLQFLAGAADNTRWVGFWIGTEDGDGPFRDALTSATAEGYHFLIRRGGDKQIYRRSSGSTAAISLGSNPSAAFAPSVTSDGGVKEFEVVIDATTVTLRCLTDGTEATVADATYRGTKSVLSVMANGTSVVLSDVRVSR